MLIYTNCKVFLCFQVDKEGGYILKAIEETQNRTMFNPI